MRREMEVGDTEAFKNPTAFFSSASPVLTFLLLLPSVSASSKSKNRFFSLQGST